MPVGGEPFVKQRRRYLPSVLWHQADCEYPSDPDGRRARYLELLRTNGHGSSSGATAGDAELGQRGSTHPASITRSQQVLDAREQGGALVGGERDVT